MEHDRLYLMKLADRIRGLRHLIDEGRVDGDWSIERRELAMDDLLNVEIFIEDFADSLTLNTSRND